LYFLHLWLLVDPVVLGELPGVELLWLEPESNLLLGAIDAVGAVADVAADVLERKEVLAILIFLFRFLRQTKGVVDILTIA